MIRYEGDAKAPHIRATTEKWDKHGERPCMDIEDGAPVIVGGPHQRAVSRNPIT